MVKILGRELPTDVYSLVVAFLIGIASGVVVAFFTDVFVWANRFRYAYLEPNPPLFALVSFSCVLGTALFLKKLLGTLHGSSTSYVVKSYHTKLGYIGVKELVVYTIGAISSVLAGAVVGPEGPGIALGAFFGYWISKRMGLKGEDLKRMALVGGAAGIASVFRAPVTAMAFAMEIPYKKSIEGGIFLQALVATLTSYLVTVVLAGPQRLLLETRPFKPPFPSPFLLLVSISMGVGAAALTYMMYFIKHKSGEISDKLEHMKYWIVLPLALATIVVAATYLISPLVPGAGDVLTEKVFNEPESLSVPDLAIITVSKAAILGISLTWGTTGGIFMPLVAIGSALGLLYAKLFHVAHVEPIIMAGVSSIFAATMKTLLTSILIGVEFLGFGAFFTSTVAASVSYLLTLNISLVAGQLPEAPDVKKRSIVEIYEKLKQKKAAYASLERPIDVVTNKNVIRFTKYMTVGEALEVASKDTHTYYPVVDENDKLLGEVSLEELVVEDPKRKVIELAYWPGVVVFKGVPIRFAVELMIDRNEDHAVVIDERGRMYGMATKADILKYLLEVLEKIEEMEASKTS